MNSFLCRPAAIDRGDRVDQRLDPRGERKTAHLDAQGDRIDHRLDRHP